MAKRVKKEKCPVVKHLPSVERDAYLAPYESALVGRADYAKRKDVDISFING